MHRARVKTATGTDPFSIPLDARIQLPIRVATGSGFYAVEPSIMAIYPSDSAVFFANLGYIYGVHATTGLASTGGVGTASIDPGRAIHLSVGLGFGINEASSFGIGYGYKAFSSQAIGGVTLLGTAVRIGSVLLSYSYRLNNRVSLNLTHGDRHDAGCAQHACRAARADPASSLRRQVANAGVAACDRAGAKPPHITARKELLQ